jgi:hypothetical protein
MSETLGELFSRAKGAPIQVDGITIHAIYRRYVVANQLVRVRWRRYIETPVQGVRLKLHTGRSLTMNGRRLKDVVLWSDTSPPEVELLCDEEGELRIWNCWRDSTGAIQAWIGNAGMVIETSSSSTVLKRSGGTSSFSPDDLELELQFL